jgi:hypothetical protein
MVGIKFQCQPALVTTVSSGEVLRKDAGFWRKYDGWWQVTGGSVHANGSIASTIPASLDTPAEQALIKSDINGKDGLVSYGTTTNLGSNPEVTDPRTSKTIKVSASNRAFNQTYGGIQYNYAYFNAKLSGLKATSWDGSGSVPAYSDPTGAGYMLIKYTGGGALNFPALAVIGVQKYIILSPQSVNVNGYITVAPGAFLTLISNGTITFNNALGRIDPTDNDVNKVFTGWFVADSIDFGTTGNESTEKQFHGEGSFVAWNGFTLKRNWGKKNNAEAPEEFVYRDDLMTNAPNVLKFAYKNYAP